jgi:endonuclease/exonuclease/phosphatase family metal-dependent hydrolase
MMSKRTGQSGWRSYSFFFLLLVVSASQACVAATSLGARHTVELSSLDAPHAVSWFAPLVDGDNALLTRWRKSVGPPVVVPASFDDEAHDALTIVSWNTAVGDADIVGFVRAQAEAHRPLVMLLQEVYRSGSVVPSKLDDDCAFAGRLGGVAAGRDQREIEEVGRLLGLGVYYVPSMRNGGEASSEDRGNAILSNLPLLDLQAIELPFERQRRVAIAATVEGRTSSGDPWRVRVVSAHLDNMGTAKRAWIGSEYGRARQARGLATLLRDDQPTILAGDFNTWFGFADQAYRETAREFPETRVTDRRPTFRGLLRLDHVFYRLPREWRLDVHRGESRFGSDHYPLMGSLRFR